MKPVDIPLIRPTVRFEDVEPEFRKVIESGQLTSGQFVARFEREVADTCGVADAISTTSATTALHLALHAVGVGPGSEVAVSDFTFPATANAVIQTGATPVLVDSQKDRFAMDPVDLESKISAKTSAIMPVDPFGQPADYREIGRIAHDASIPVIADAACSLGATQNGVRSGALGDMGCFSFHPRKIITCGEGGMITTDDEALGARLRSLRSHGAVRGDQGMVFHEPGFNYRMSELQAVLGSSQIGRLSDIIADRQLTASRYDERLSGIESIEVHTPPAGDEWSYQSYVIVLDDDVDRDRVISEMRNAGIETTIGTYACHAHPAYAEHGYSAGDLPNSFRFQRQALTLPVLPQMEESTIDRVSSQLVQILKNASWTTT